MYPFIMASTPFPLDMSTSEIVHKESEVTLTVRDFHEYTRFAINH